MALPAHADLTCVRSIIRHAFATMTVAASIAFASACAHAPGRTAAVVAPPCTGRRVLVVHNHTDAAVDVYAYSRGASRQILGTASPGDHELYLGNASGPFAAKAVNGEGVVAATGTQEPHVMDRVTFETSCRPI